MKNYLDLMSRILKYGDIKDSARENMPRTKELFGEILKFNLQDGFPLLTTKRLFTRGIIEELLFFLRGSTNVSDLIKKNINIWNEDGYKFYKKNNPNSKSFDKWVEDGKNCNLGNEDYDLGKIYGYHWRKWGKDFFNKKNGDEIIVDQICNLINTIINRPNSRYQLVSTWNPSILEIADLCLPSCHIMFQTTIRNKEYLDMYMIQRSVDTPCGLPFNIASYALLNHLLSFFCGYKPGIFTWFGGSVHIYENQIDGCIEQLNRIPKEKPTLIFNNNNIKKLVEYGKINGYTSEILNDILNKISYEDFVLENYEPYSTIKFPLSTGLKLEKYNKVW